MVKTVKTFGDYLRQFARSVDIVDERTIEEIRKLVYDYVRDELEAAYFSLACEQTVDSRPGLRTVWSTENEEHATTIRTLDGRYSSQISVSFDQRKPLWVVSREQKPLRQSETYDDLWSEVPDLPRYEAPSSSTSVRPTARRLRAPGTRYPSSRASSAPPSFHASPNRRCSWRSRAGPTTRSWESSRRY